MADTDDVPPLEDMSELLQQVESLREHNAAKVSPSLEKSTTVPKSHPSTNQIVPQSGSVGDKEVKSVEKSTNGEVKKRTTETTTFGGMKKGFLFGSSSSKKTSANSIGTNKRPPSETTEEIPYIKPTDPEAKEKRHQMPEVQEAMKASQSFLDKKDWVTEDLLERVQKNPVLAQHLADPKFSQALGEFQRNPEGAMTKYSDNPEIQLFFKEFCGLLGDHFSKLGDSQPRVSSTGSQTSGDIKVSQGADIKVHNPNAPSLDDERRMQEILTKPDVRDILMDPQIQKLFGELRTNPQEAQQKLLQTKDRDLHKKISRLVEVGLLQFQS